MKRNLLFILLAVGLHASAQFSRETYTDLLNLRGPLPQGHIVQTTTMVFSDLGAWHGYGLPAPANLESGFTGPVLFDDLGLVLSPGFSNLSLSIDGKPFKFTNSHSTYYPGMLQIKARDAGIELAQSLVFSDAREALIKISIENHTKFRQQAALTISGTLNPGVGTLSAAGKKLTVQRRKGIFTSEFITDQDINITANDSAYTAAATSPLKPGKSIIVYIRQSNFIDEADRTHYQPAATLNPKDIFSKNRQRWNSYISRALHTPANWLKDSLYRRLAVKSIITLITNWRSAAGELKHAGIFPTYNYFDGFWAWDSWKHAAGCALFAPELAKDNIRSMFDYQDQDGMIADCVFIDTTRNNYRNTKPPLAAWAVWEVYQKTGDRSFIKEMYPKLLAYHQWWYTHRDHDHNGLCEYGSNNGEAQAAAWESGMDNAVRFDSAKMVQNGPKAWSFDQESVDLNSFLYLEKCLLAKMAVLLQEDPKPLLSAAESLKTQINKYMYDSASGFYYDIRLSDKSLIRLKGPEGWVPLWTKVASTTQARNVIDNIEDSTQFNTYLPFPTFQANHPAFKATAYWRGPVWFDQAMFGIEACRQYQKTKIADQLQRKLLHHAAGLLEDGPIGETYDPLTGKSLTTVNFGWSAVAILRLLTL